MLSPNSESAALSALSALSKRCLRYGVTEEWYESELEKTGGRCPICRRWPAVCIDHDSKCCTGCARCVRGVLCHECNSGIGMLRHVPDALRRAADYLEAHSVS